MLLGRRRHRSHPAVLDPASLSRRSSQDLHKISVRGYRADLDEMLPNQHYYQEPIQHECLPS